MVDAHEAKRLSPWRIRLPAALLVCWMVFLAWLAFAR